MRRKIFLIICIGVLIISSIPFISLFFDSIEQSQLNNEIKQTVEMVDEDQISFAELKKINPDLVAILYVSNSDLYLPIVQTDNNNYYLDHDFKRQNNEYGAVFMDYRSNADFSSNNTFIYGHSVLGGNTWEMFTFLKEYMNYEFYKEHPTITIVTENGSYDYQVFSSYESSGNSESYQPILANDEQYSNYLNLVQTKSFYKTDISVQKEDRIITLYTCSLKGITRISELHSNDKRYFIHAVLIDHDEL